MAKRPASPGADPCRARCCRRASPTAGQMRTARRGGGGKFRFAGCAFVLAVLGACGGGGSQDDDPLALAGKPSDACSQAIVDGHNMEAAGRPTPFLPSIEACGSLAEWTEAAKKFGIDLKGREAQFVDNTCNAASDEVKALKICQEAKAAVSDPRRIP